MNNGRKFPKKFASEYCILWSGQKPKVEKDRHKAEMIRASAEAAPERLKQICNMVENETLFPQHVEDFGVKLDKKPMEAEGMSYKKQALITAASILIHYFLRHFLFNPDFNPVFVLIHYFFKTFSI